MTTTEKIIDETFIIHQTLGQGFTSEVVLGEHKETGYKLAIKMFKPLKDVKLMVESFRKEVDSMKNFKHPNLINIIAANENGVYVRPGHNKQYVMYLGVELAENAELFDFIADPGYGFNEKMARALFKQMMAGLKSMHEIKVAHRDLKTENIFLDSNFNLKLGDFGFSKFMDPHHNEGKLKTQLGTSGYQCPELIEKQLYSGESNDIFACGVILFILVNAYPPFREAKKTDNWYRHIYYDKPENFWTVHSKKCKISNELKELISGMLRYKNRWTMHDIENCEWLKGSLPTQDEYIADMSKRKVKVDERRKREAEEKLLAEGGDSGSGVYRGEAEEEIISQLVKQLEESKISTTLKLERQLPKTYLRFEGDNHEQIIKNLITLIVNEGGKVKLDDEKYSLTAEEVPLVDELLPSDGNEKEEDVPKVDFTATLYTDENTQSTIVDFIKHDTCDYISFKMLISYFNKKINGE